jgi:hypothetical protein
MDKLLDSSHKFLVGIKAAEIVHLTLQNAPEAFHRPVIDTSTNPGHTFTHWRYIKDGSVSDFADLVIVLGFVLIVLLIIVGFRVYMLQDTKQALSSYLFIVAGTLILIGLAAHSNISESSMIRSEYQYLVTYGAKIKQSDIEQPSTHWRDYCQVLVNLCVNVSGVHSEDKGYHTIYEMLQRMWEALPDGSCANQSF